MKKIIVQWVRTADKFENFKRLKVISSNHPQYTQGTRFDLGFMEIATVKQGYTVEILPLMD